MPSTIDVTTGGRAIDRLVGLLLKETRSAYDRATLRARRTLNSVVTYGY
jgi:hypothetical protein